MVDDAEIQSRRVIAEAEAEARRRGENERRRLEEEVVELAGRRDTLLADVDALNRFESDYRERMVRSLEADLSALRSRATAAPGSRPEPVEVDVPVIPDAIAPQEGSSRETSPPAATSEAEAAPAASDLPSPSAPADATTDDRIGAELAAGLDAPDSVPEPIDEPETRALDVRSLFEGDDVLPAEPARAAAAAGDDASLDLLGPEALDPEVLDDDAFFATLREAVSDDAPLGPRDEDDITGDNRFFDQDADRGSFRDVFRRRR
jgi:hypothetical protein